MSGQKKTVTPDSKAKRQLSKAASQLGKIGGKKSYESQKDEWSEKSSKAAKTRWAKAAKKPKKK